MPRSQTPADSRALAVASVENAAFRANNDVGSAIYDFRGSITQPAGSLCTLRNRGHPAVTQHSVPAGGSPLPDQDSHLLGPARRFLSPTHMTSSISKLGLAQCSLRAYESWCVLGRDLVC